MKIFLSIFFSFSFLFMSAQNWSLINKDYEYHFAINGEYHTTVKVDSFEVNASDTTFFLNRIVSPCDSCIAAGSDEYLRYNQPTFLQRQVLQQGNEFTFTDTTTFILKPNENLNATWVFDAVNNVSAEIVALNQESIFGVVDSVKTILLAGNDTVKLSKQFGIIKFKAFNLIGVNTQNSNFGFKLPNHMEFYDFNVGDVFMYEQNNFSGSVSPYPPYEHFKITILSKEINTNSYTYQINEKKAVFYDAGALFFSINDEEITYNANNTPLAQTYNNELIEHPYDPIYAISYTSKDLDGVFEKNFGGENLNLESSTFEENLNNILKSHPLIYRKQIKLNLGEVYFHETQFEGSTERRLIGYIKNGVQTGEVWEDWQFTSVKNLSNESNISVFPNPSSDIVFVHFETPEQNLNIHILDNLDKKVLEQSFSNQKQIQLDVSSFSKGIYFMKLETENGVFQQKIMLR